MQESAKREKLSYLVYHTNKTGHQVNKGFNATGNKNLQNIFQLPMPGKNVWTVPAAIKGHNSNSVYWELGFVPSISVKYTCSSCTTVLK